MKTCFLFLINKKQKEGEKKQQIFKKIFLPINHIPAFVK